MLVEFWGLPGSGKTTIALRACELLRESGFSAGATIIRISRSRIFLRAGLKTIRALGTIFRSPSCFIKISRMVARSEQSSPLAHAKLVFNALFVLSFYRHRDDSSIELIDQGILQAFSSIRYSASSDIRLSEFLGTVGSSSLLPDAVIFCDAPNGVLGARLLARKGIQSRVERDLSAGLPRLREIMKDDRRALTELRGAIRLLDLDDSQESDDIETRARSACRIIVELMEISNVERY